MKWICVIALLAVAAFAFGGEAVEEVAETPWAWVIPLVIVTITAILKGYQGGKYKRYLDAALNLNRIVYSAAESASAKNVKDLVRDAVERAASGEISEINDLLVPLVDPKKADSAPPIKRFWRRFLAGKNLPGVVARVALKNALAETLEK